MRGAERAATLTQRLLAFSRRQPLEPEAARRQPAGRRHVRAAAPHARREHRDRDACSPAGCGTSLADANQLESALLNLAVNARDAMPEGGKLTIETANAISTRPTRAGARGACPGQYVLIAVTDTGTGMTRGGRRASLRAVLHHQGGRPGHRPRPLAGLGFVKQSGGHVKIYSEPGQGTTVKLYLPRLAAATASAEARRRARTRGRRPGSETILVVEDDERVRAYSVEMLRELGYRVLEAADGRARARGCSTREPEIDLLFTDVGLPGGMNGRQLADEAQRRRPDLKVLFTTGYARNAIVHHGRLDPGVELIVKPFTYAALAAKVRQVLDGP